MMKRALVLTALLGLCFSPGAFCQSAAGLFAEAKAAQAAGKRDVAFLFHRQVLRQYPDSQYAEESEFLVGQYYYDTRNYFNASQTFQGFIRKYPRSRFGKAAKAYLARIQLGSLKERADRLFEEAKLGPASVLYQQYLEIDPDNLEVKARLEQIKKTQQELHFGFEQLNRERRKFEQEKDTLTRQIAELEGQRKQVLTLQKQALELNKVTVEKYEKRLALISTQTESMNVRIAELEKEVAGWRRRAVLAESEKLSRPLSKSLKPLPEGTKPPLIVFEGGKADPSPGEGETQVSDIVREGFPAVVVTGAKLDTKKNLRHVEAIVSVDLNSPWPEGAKMKFRVDFVAKAGQPTPDPEFLVRYFDVSDMDEMEQTTNSYRKRVLFTAQEKLTMRYDISAFLVTTK
ncbi:hypothetical protein HQ563_10785 [bacterium]|nr:hypothetical protein [bacterium]